MLEQALNGRSGKDFRWCKMAKYDTWIGVRGKRNLLLSQSDWTQLPDAPLTAEQRQEWSKYRQDLRDLPQTFENAEDVVYPEGPM